MASVFKTKVAMLDIIKKFADELSQIGFKIHEPRLTNNDGQHEVYIDNEFVGDVYFHYQKDNRRMRRIVIRFNYEVKIYHNITYNADKVEEEYNIKLRDSETRYVTENTVDILYEIKQKLQDVYRNYKKAQNKIKELKMNGDFSEQRLTNLQIFTILLPDMKKIILLTILLFSLVFSSKTEGTFADLYYISKGSEIIQSVNKNITEQEAFQISTVAYEESEKYDIDFHFTLGIMTTESRFNVNAKSYCGAVGLMQLMPKTAKYIAEKYDIDYKNLYDIESNIQIGVAYLYHLKTKFGSYELTAAGYNGGSGGAIKYRDYITGKRKADEIHNQTLNYVPKVMGYVYDYRKLTKI